MLSAILASEHVPDEDADAMCVDVLALNYHVTLAELVAGRWLGEVFRAQVLTHTMYTGEEQ
jgi:hypothetical protein